MVPRMNSRQAIWIIWIGCALAILLGSGWIATVGRVVLWFVLIAHVVEFVMNLALFRRVGGSMARHLTQTLIYGYFYWGPIKAKARLAGEDGR